MRYARMPATFAMLQAGLDLRDGISIVDIEVTTDSRITGNCQVILGGEDECLFQPIPGCALPSVYYEQVRKPKET